MFTSKELEEVRLKLPAFFFEAMRHGWAYGAAPITNVVAIPGAKGFKFANGDFKLVDYYFSNKYSRSSYGTKIITYFDVVVWMMHYGRWYDKKAIPIVKAALRAAYNGNMFCGGRGPEKFYQNNGDGVPCLYENHFKGDFASFNGGEFVTGYGSDLEFLGEHHFFGGLLI